MSIGVAPGAPTWNDAFVDPTPVLRRSEEDPKVWLSYLENLAAYKSVTPAQLFKMFPRLFRGTALVGRPSEW